MTAAIIKIERKEGTEGVGEGKNLMRTLQKKGTINLEKINLVVMLIEMTEKRPQLK